jgi:HK97 gp10 family phage protein
LGTAVKAGADVIRDDAKSRVHSISGDLEKGIISTITWDKNKSKAFAGVGMDKAMNDKFLVTTKSGTRYYIPTAVEYGHRSPGGAMNIAVTKKGYHKKSKKGTRAHPFMRPAYKSKKSEVAQIIERYILAVIEEGD